MLATKAGYETWDRPPDFSAAAIVASTERSLAGCGTDYVDLLQLHNPPIECLAPDECSEALARLVAERQDPGLGRFGQERRPTRSRRLRLRGAGRPGQLQHDGRPRGHSGLFDEVARRDAGFIARTPLCFGFLSGTIGDDTIFPPGDHRLGWSRAQLDNWIDGRRDLLAAVSAAPGEAAVQSALRFCLSFPAVSSVIPGILTAAEAGENGRAGELGPLPAEAVEAVLAINRNREFFVAAGTRVLTNSNRLPPGNLWPAMPAAFAA